MISTIFLSGLGLVFVFEGILPFASPALWRKVMQHMFIQSDRSLRIMGLVSMLIGLILVIMARDLF